ncbi:substrate-binding periplasmic protein [Chitinimonas sp.]|uniref:substrate-binding periplasmic protein n=1 Tax=Chitinimonas sp. TaxID=1934313 RepID=UPI002F93BDBE
MHVVWLGLLTLSALAPYKAGAACDKLVYATNPKYPPYGWSEDDAHYQGAAEALLRLVAPANVTLQPVVYPWKRAQALAESGEVDLLLALRITPERERYLSFTRSRAFHNPIAVFVPAGSPLKTADWNALASYRGAVSSGDFFGNGFDAFLRTRLQVEVAPSVVENFKKLRAGRVDYFVTGEQMGLAYLRNTEGPQMGNVTVLKPYISDGDIHFGFSRRSPCLSLLPEMDARMAQADQKGTSARLLEEAMAQFIGRAGFSWKTENTAAPR